MKLIPILRSLITFQVPKELADIYHKCQSSQNQLEKRSTIEKVWVDNVFRAWVTILTFLVCIGLYFSGSIKSFLPITITFVSYVSVEAFATWMLFKQKYHRATDYVLCAMDMIALSAGIYLTGGPSSPLYLLYFIPLVIQAFHRDWALILFYGVSAVACYAISLSLFLESNKVFDFFNFSMRILSMIIAVGSAVLAVNLIRKRQNEESNRLLRMEIQTQVTQTLNDLLSYKDLPFYTEKVVEILNNGFSKQHKSWSRIFLMDQTGSQMTSVMDSSRKRLDLKQELSVVSCPAASANASFVLDNAHKDHSCPTESFSFSSHYCVSISGTGNEAYGVLFTGSDRVNTFKKEEKDFLDFIARTLGLTIQRIKRVEELQLSFEMDSCAMATYVASTKGLEQTYRSILDGIQSILRTEQASLMLWDPTEGCLKVKDVIGPNGAKEAIIQARMGEGILGKVLEKSKPIWTSDIKDDPCLKDIGFSFRSLISIPLQSIKGETIGVVNAWHLTEGEKVSNYEIDVGATFITRAALAVENALLHLKHQNTVTDASLPKKTLGAYPDDQEEDKAA